MAKQIKTKKFSNNSTNSTAYNESKVQLTACIND